MTSERNISSGHAGVALRVPHRVRVPLTVPGGAAVSGVSFFFVDNLLFRIHFTIVMIRWTGLAPWEQICTSCTPCPASRARAPHCPRRLLITEVIQEDSPFCLTRAITRTMIGLCYTPLSLAPRDAAVSGYISRSDVADEIFRSDVWTQICRSCTPCPASHASLLLYYSQA